MPLVRVFFFVGLVESKALFSFFSHLTKIKFSD
jgi:hypothetical protein